MTCSFALALSSSGPTTPGPTAAPPASASPASARDRSHALHMFSWGPSAAVQEASQRESAAAPSCPSSCGSEHSSCAEAPGIRRAVQASSAALVSAPAQRLPCEQRASIDSACTALALAAALLLLGRPPPLLLRSCPSTSASLPPSSCSSPRSSLAASPMLWQARSAVPSSRCPSSGTSRRSEATSAAPKAGDGRVWRSAAKPARRAPTSTALAWASFSAAARSSSSTKLRRTCALLRPRHQTTLARAWESMMLS
jgi:hypothetical protein